MRKQIPHHPCCNQNAISRRSLVPKIEEFTLCATQVVKPKQQCQIFKLAEKWVYKLMEEKQMGHGNKIHFSSICNLHSK